MARRRLSAAACRERPPPPKAGRQEAREGVERTAAFVGFDTRRRVGDGRSRDRSCVPWTLGTLSRAGAATVSTTASEKISPEDECCPRHGMGKQVSSGWSVLAGFEQHRKLAHHHGVQRRTATTLDTESVSSVARFLLRFQLRTTPAVKNVA